MKNKSRHLKSTWFKTVTNDLDPTIISIYQKENRSSEYLKELHIIGINGTQLYRYS